MNSNEKIISDMSYVNKDFNSIYSELLDTAKVLSDRWDPSLSNESDPGVVLLKLNALVADKNNYNIDKNILECFPLSVTQQANARKLYDLLGYNMHWCRSAETEITMSVIDYTNLSENGVSGSVGVPIFTAITDDSKSITYTTIEQARIPVKENGSDTVKVLEGTIHSIEIDGQQILTVENLDENLRLYFNETQVAENGIFITTSETDWNDAFTWTRVDNLTNYLAGNKVYKFGTVANSDICYIEFPKDIAELITNTFRVNYIITTGSDGVVNSNKLVQFVNDDALEGTSDITLNTAVKITQPIASSGGNDIETLLEAYENYKKSVGVFNTLITGRDYEYAISQLKEIGNVIIADRTNDLNFTNHIMTWNGISTEKELIVQSLSTSKTEPAIQPFDLIEYLLLYRQPIDEDSYNKGFNILNTNILSETDTVESYEDIINNAIESNKSIQHNMQLITNMKAPYPTKALFNNKYTLKGLITTYYKVTANEKKDIENNIKTKLLSTYSADKMSFGEQPSYDDIIETIKTADSRINNVSLNPLEYKVVHQKIETTEDKGEIIGIKVIADEKVDNDELVARMVLSGNVQLYDFDDDFIYDFGQKDGEVIETESRDIIKLTTETEIAIDEDNIANVGENELLQFVAPNYITTKQYSINVKYNWTGNKISANTDYTIGKNEILSLTYKDSDGVMQSIDFTEGQLINSTFEISGKIGVTGVIGVGQSISIKERNESELSAGVQYLPILNSGEITLAKNASYILQEDEYFIYTDLNFTDLVIQGTGTRITNEAEKDIILKTPSALNLDSIQTNVTQQEWKSLVDSDKLRLTEMSIYSLGEGGKAKFDEKPKKSLTNDYQSVDGGIELQDALGKITNLPKLGTNDNWKVRSRLNLNCTQYVPQKLTGKQSIYIWLQGQQNEEKESVTKLSDISFMFNYPVKIAGGENLKIDVITDTSTGYLHCYSFTEEPISNKRVDGILRLGGKAIKDEISLPFTFKENKEYIVPIYLVDTNINAKIATNINATEIVVGDNFLKFTPSGDISNLTLSSTTVSDNASIYIDYINITKDKGYNESEINVSKAYSDNDEYSVGTAVDTKINTITENFISPFDKKLLKFNPTYRVKDVDKVVQPTLSVNYFNKNHIYNKYTIAQINTSTYSITVDPNYIL